MLFEITLKFGVFLLVVMVTSVWSHGSHGTSAADHHDFDKETIQDKEYVGTLTNNCSLTCQSSLCNAQSLLGIVAFGCAGIMLIGVTTELQVAKPHEQEDIINN